MSNNMFGINEMITGTGILGEYPTSGEYSIRFVTEQATNGNVIQVSGRIKGQTNFDSLLTLTGIEEQNLVVAPYDCLRVTTLVYNALSGKNHVRLLASGIAETASGGDVIAATTSSDYFRGDKTFQPSINLPISTLTQTALNLKADKIGDQILSGTKTINGPINTVITVGNPTGAIVNITFSEPFFQGAQGNDIQFRVYAYKLVNGVKVFSQGYSESSIVNEGTSGDGYHLDYVWNAVTGADGYRVFFLPGTNYQDVVGSTALTQPFNAQSGGVTSPSSPQTEYAGKSLIANGDVDVNGDQVNFGDLRVHGTLVVDVLDLSQVDVAVKTISVGAGTTHFYESGTVTMASGEVVVNNAGDAIFKSISINGGLVSLNQDGNCFFGSLTGDGSGLINLPTPYDQALNTNNDAVFNSLGIALLKNYGGGVAIDLNGSQGGILVDSTGNNAQLYWGVGHATVKNELRGGDPDVPSWTITSAGAASLKSLAIKEGSNCSQGVATLVAGVVIVSNTNITANSRIFLTPQNTSGTAGSVGVSARTIGTNFTISSTNTLDTRLIAYQIFEPA